MVRLANSGIRYYWILCIFYISVGCKTDKKNTDFLESKVRLSKISRGLTIPIDNETSYESYCLFPFEENNKSYLGFLNSFKNEINIYALEDRILLKKVPLEIEGPNGVGKVYGFQIISFDSIFIASQLMQLSLIDSSGKVHKRISYLKTQDNRLMFGMIKLSSTRYAKLILESNTIITLVDLVGDWASFTQDYLDNQPIELEINLQDSIVRPLPMTYPRTYLENGLKPFQVSREFANGQFIYSFCSDHDIYVTRDHTTLKDYYAKSNYIHSNIQPLPHPLTIPSYQKYLVENPEYGSIVYDKYRMVYYRFCNLDSKLNSDDNINTLIKYPPKQSIIILDLNFNKIGETLLPEKTYNLNNFFIQKDGLYISTNTPYNPNLNEDVLNFDVFNLVDVD